MVFDAAEAKAGDSIGVQIGNAAKNLDENYWTVWNWWRGRVGKRSFPRLKGAYARYTERRMAKDRQDARALARRLSDLEQTLEAVRLQDQADTGRTVLRPRNPLRSI